MPAAEATRPGLIERARCGDEAAFTALLEELTDPAYRLALAMLRDRSAAEDAVQEAVLKAWRKIGTLREGTTTARRWFLTIVANQCRSMRRGRWFRVLLVEQAAGVAETFESRVLDASDLRREMGRLSDQQRLALVLHFYLDLPLAEVARILGVQPAAAKSRIYRAARALRPGLVEREVVARARRCASRSDGRWRKSTKRPNRNSGFGCALSRSGSRIPARRPGCCR